MTRSIDFYFDYLSPYAYLAWLRLPEVCTPRKVQIVARPVLFAGLLNYWGHLGPAEIPPKGQHVFKECARFAAMAGIPFRSPRYHPFRPLTALRVSLAEVAQDRQTDVISAIFAAGWAEGEDLGDAETIGAALQSAGLDGNALLSAAYEPSAKLKLRQETQTAVEAGVFGIPTMLVDGELFWGLDQLPYLAMFLDGKDPLDSIDVSKITSEGRAAVRPASLQRGPHQDR
ncbi:MAG: 2-hydroxychromene-2-carboxylate isomerase [Pseudomonadales bacterium]|jgi:2-hydroxychromene-2-carboxylate isomerase|nr:2-hydroxychromene-2-carboxylate isomerase [Pseudomonadales bacterium]MDP7594063.1 2-hydroxychromene-2-carboxylate isomerase [Pseudomonadales bacterium]HJN53142.1 2-hydroxychromene-2-carboxylate isomerase [Pseudomonadales bacterium]|tara:strand:+ start:640 stop:1326 length:687 start_codon:yes stop_codon:yes gene_type:complete